MAPTRKGDKRKQKKGNARNFITRTQAVRKLQISLPDFRRLCIFKGIYPREPRDKKKASKSSTPATTFYYTKDIQYLLHEPLIQKFREHKALAKKIGRALGRNEVGDASRLEKAKPRMTLDHIIKERYPTFVDALRDLDDALSMLFLFANLPSTASVPPKTIALCQRLCLEFEHYLITSHSLRKSFLSIKGIYYQATIQGQDILWLVPYKFVQKMTGDIDFRIMGTFIEFYTTLMGFVNYRLYATIGLVYPPKFNRESDDKGGELGAITLEGEAVRPPHESDEVETSAIPDTSSVMAPPEVQAAADLVAKLADVEADGEDDSDPSITNANNTLIPATDALDTFEPLTTDEGDILIQPTPSSSIATTLFSSIFVYLSRETPRGPLELLLKAFGCTRVGWDAVLGDGAFTVDEMDPRITHQIVDRSNVAPRTTPAPDQEGEEEGERVSRPKVFRVPGRVYVQPQWVWDCVNEGRLLRTDFYAPGATLPPHLSPWVKPKRGEYDPRKKLEEQEAVTAAELAELEAEAAEEAMEAEKQLVRETEGVDVVAAMESDSSESEGEDEYAEVMPGEGMNVDEGSEDGDSEDGFQSEEAGDSEDELANDLSEEEDPRSEYQRELEAEAAGQPHKVDAGNTPAKKLSEARKRAAKRQREEREELERRRGMLPKKKGKVFDRVMHSRRKREEEAERKMAKRRKLERDRRRA